MSTARYLLDQARTAGVAVFLEGEKLIAEGPATAALKEQLRAHKPEIIELLSRERGEISIDRIRIDGGTQPRAQLNESVVSEYAEALTDGAKLPPVTVFFDGSDHWLADGFHRYEAHRRIGATEIPADVRAGSRRDAQLYSKGANAAHGLRRSNADKRQAVLSMLEDEEWGQWSDREIAKQCRVGNRFVGDVRRVYLCPDTDSSVSLCPDTVRTPPPRAYRTKHGTVATMSTANIGRKQEPAPVEPPATEPTPKPTEPEPAPEGEPEPEDFNLAVELDAALKENQRLQQLNESLQKDDLGRELAHWQQRYAQLEGRLRAETTTLNQLRRTADGQGRLLDKLRRTLGADSGAGMVQAVIALRQRVSELERMLGQEPTSGGHRPDGHDGRNVH